MKPFFHHLFPLFSLDTFTFKYWNEERGNFSKNRQEQHKLAKYDLRMRDLNRTDKYRKTFIKTELANHTEDYQVRCISGATDRFNAYFGTPIYGFSKALGKCWDKHHWILYTSGTTADDISDWTLEQCARIGVNFDSCLKILSDESRQDAHVSAPALEWEHEFFTWVGLPLEVVMELKDCIRVKGFSTFGLKYDRIGSRNTGDPHTSSANSLMNALKAVYTLWKLLPPFDISCPPFALCIQGDDSFIITKCEYESYVSTEAITQISADLGFLVKFVTITTAVVEVDYCSRYFWPTDDHPLGYVLGPKIGKVLNKISFSKVIMKDLKQHNRGIALGLAKDVNHIPFLKELVERILELTEGSASPARVKNYSITSESFYQSNDQTWDHLFLRYGLTQSDLAVFVSNLETVESFPWKLTFPIDLQFCVEKDS